MSRTLLTLVVLLAAFHAGRAQGGGIERVAWLEGCWETSSPGRTVEERWTPVRGGSMVGVSRTIRHGKLSEYEFILLREEGDRLAYVAHPSGQEAATFLSVRIEPAEVVFENPQHDFPKTIGYRIVSNVLLMTIDDRRSTIDDGSPTREPDVDSDMRNYAEIDGDRDCADGSVHEPGINQNAHGVRRSPH